ncbi:acyltransferase [Desulfonema ishimotonii]|uniref:Acyltransferase n=1 Tax=Desulfonema ishimotonii TaxID=45657 RepID=A0A401FR07_9BACT|nr:acyltransferase [Desulfonema ishimotonii]GBC59393.1 acyltransferase [Desulfonema ishimotonii]
MFKSLLTQLRGALSFLIYLVNTIFWVPQICLAAIVKFLIPLKPFRKLCDRFLNRWANNWIWINNLTTRTFCNIRWHVFGLESLKPDDWYMVVANHQSWVDILVLQKIFYRKIPFLKFFLKKELFWVPIIGLAWWALDFPFMKRYSSQFIKKNPHLKGRDLEVTRKACEKFKTIPVSVMNFAEGTRFTGKKHAKQDSPYVNLLKPKAGGMAFALNAMGGYLSHIVDVTIAYPGGAKTFWDYLCGNVTDIRVQVRTLPVTPEMLGNYFEDEQFRQAFQNWVNNLWTQKDQCITELLAAPQPSAETVSSVLPRFHAPFPVTEGNIFQEDSPNAGA